MSIAFPDTATHKYVVTFTEVEEDAYKIKVEELFKNGRRADLLDFKEVLGYPGIIERTDLHLTREAAQELWQMAEPTKGDLMLHLSSVNSAGQRFVESVQYTKYITTKIINYLERIAASLHAQRKRQAAKAEKELAAAAKAAKAAAAKAARAAKKSKKSSSSSSSKSSKSSGSKGSKGSKGSRRRQ